MYNQLNNNKWKYTALYYISVCSIILGTLTWVPNIIFKKPMSFWIFSVPLGMIGVVCAVYIKKRILLILSTLVVFSFFILMTVGYASNALSDYLHPKVSAVNFLKEYYTVQEYKDMPESLEDINKLSELYEAYIEDTEIDRMIRNRTILEPSMAAQKRQCTLEVTDVKVESLEETSSLGEAIYEYWVDIEVTDKDHSKINVEQVGQLRMNKMSNDAIITYFAPEKSVSQLLELF